jgi:hypothetical protein
MLDLRSLRPISVSCLLACGAQPSVAPSSPTVGPPLVSESSGTVESSSTSTRVIESERTITVSADTSFERPFEWPEAVVFPSGIDPVQARVTDAVTGDLLVEHDASSIDAEELAARWDETFRSRGFEPRESCDPPPGICVYASDERVASLHMVTRGETSRMTVHLLPPGHVPLSRLPGPCVEPPSRTRDVMVHASAVDQSGERREGSVRWRIEGHAGPDLDGDGRPEWFVPHETSKTCPWEIPHDVYVMRGTCGHKVGTVIGQLDVSTHTAPFRKGIREVHTTATWATHGRVSPHPEHHTRMRTFIFDGKRLRRTRDDTRTGRCHHCGVVRCVDL